MYYRKDLAALHNGLPISGWPKAGPLHRLVMRPSQS